MKRIKTYEGYNDSSLKPSINFLYEKDDYVLLKEDSETNWKVYPFVKIVDRNSNDSRPKEEWTADYCVKTFNKKDEKLVAFWVDYNEIERKLTSDEIAEYDAREIAKKYNL